MAPEVTQSSPPTVSRVHVTDQDRFVSAAPNYDPAWYQFTLTMSNIVRSLNTPSQRQLALGRPHMGCTLKTIQFHILWDNNDINSDFQLASHASVLLPPVTTLVLSHTKEMTQHTLFLVTNEASEEFDFSDINYLWCKVCLFTPCVPCACVSPVTVGQHPKTVMFSSRWSHIRNLHSAMDI